MEATTATAIINAAGSKEAAWQVLRAYWALAHGEMATEADTAASHRIGTAYDAKYGKK